MMFMIICYDYDIRTRNWPLCTSNGWVSTKSSCRYYYLRFSSLLDKGMAVFFDGYGS